MAGGPPGTPEQDGDRYLEFWNLVFPQFDRSSDGTLTPLASPGVDTGMGLERTAAIVQGVHSTYETDIFRRLMQAAGSIAGIREDQGLMHNPSVRVIADHIRSSAFLIADGVTPSNEERGYVLRRIIRRGLRHGHKLDINERFFHKLVGPLVEEMGEAYPEFADQQDRIERTLLAEEERFAETLSQGMELLNKSIDDLEGNVIPGEVVFKLYDTFGFPADLTADVAREKGLTVDSTVFEQLMDQQRERARAASRFQADLGQQIRLDSTIDKKKAIQDTKKAIRKVNQTFRADHNFEKRQKLISAILAEWEENPQEKLDIEADMVQEFLNPRSEQDRQHQDLLTELIQSGSVEVSSTALAADYVKLEKK